MDTNLKYDSVTRILHWLSAFVILWATITGIYATTLDQNQPLKELISFVNISLTSVFIPVFVWRLLNKIIFIKFSSSWEKLYNHATPVKIIHNFMYIFVSVVLVSGVLMMDEPINIFNKFIIPRIINDKHLNELFEFIHEFSTQILGLFILLHLLAVIKHEITGNQVLRKMF